MESQEHNSAFPFCAPLLPGPRSWRKDYLQLSRWMTPILLFVFVIAMVLLWEELSFAWWSILLAALPANYLLFHHMLVRVLVQYDTRKRRPVFCIYPDFIGYFDPEGDELKYDIAEVKQLKLIYSGHEKAFWPSGKHFSGSKNSLSFQYRGIKVEWQFLLASSGHMKSLKRVLKAWYAEEKDFEEYNRGSGVPVKSRMLEG